MHESNAFLNNGWSRGHIPAAKPAELLGRMRPCSGRVGGRFEDVTAAFSGCDVVAHCAGINREIGQQAYLRVYIDGTRAVIAAARKAGVKRIVMLSFLRARPNSGSPHHESKWAAEELVRHSGIDHTIFEAGMIYGHGG